MDYIFHGPKVYLTATQDEREHIIRVCRDLVSFSKKAIFALHRSEGTLDLYNNLKHISSCLLDLESRPLKEYRKIVGGALEEFIEAIALGWFHSRTQLISYSQLVQLTYMVLQDPNNAARCLLGEAELVEGHIGFIFVGDYVMGLFDVMGELMRYAIIHMESAPRIMTVMKCFERQALEHFSESGYSFDDLIVGISQGTFSQDTRTVDNKLKTLRSSVEKVENAICDAVIRREEVVSYCDEA